MTQMSMSIQISSVNRRNGENGMNRPIESSQSAKRSTRSVESLKDKKLGELMLEENSDDELLASDDDYDAEADSKSKRQNAKRANRHFDDRDAIRVVKRPKSEALRASVRSRNIKSYRDEDIDYDEITESDATPKPKGLNSAQKLKRIKEIFPYNFSMEFEQRHWDLCEICRIYTKESLVYCQGCAVAIHQRCLGPVSERKHLVTRLHLEDCVLQCRYCVGKGGQKGGNRSFVTCKVGPNCAPFPSLKSKFQELKEGVEISPEETLARAVELDAIDMQRTELSKRINNPELVMFRCNRCMRPALYEEVTDPDDLDVNVWDPAQCIDCNSHKTVTVHLVLGWRYMRASQLALSESTFSNLPEDYKKEFLVKWVGQPYGKVEWVAGSWLHGIATAKKKNFDIKRLPAIVVEEDVIPQDFNRIDVLLDVRYSDDRSYEEMNFENEEAGLEGVVEVEKVYCKWQQVTYDDISWDTPPTKPTDKEEEGNEAEIASGRYEAFSAAYADYVRGFYIMITKEYATKSVAKFDDVPFNQLEKKVQPAELVGGQLMPYQMEGMNWLYYKYYDRHPAILADEMGLDWSLGPFLVVAPNSTISNWKREFRKWAPHMRVAAYYGIAQINRDLLTVSYNTIESESLFLKKYSWACLVVDEGQRLKNDESILFRLLAEYRVNHRILLTGTPLQNNTKELFNLLQFLDPKKMNATKLEAHFDIEKQESLSELHQMLQPYFLRRTKVQVLKFLPSKNEVIVPVSMCSLQKELYKTILSKNAELMRLVMSRSSAGKPIQNYNNTSLGNVLQQIRKILSHPFIYSPDIEEKIENEQQSLVNLTNACAKLQLLRLLLPNLKAKGHRILIFCQFIMMLDILEDWMNATGIAFCRIDGNTPTPERQDSIDNFNAPDSKITCFLLSTRAGGVGINLATADTVIIYDADFNPHQDLQAVARAHRIGQKNKVVVFTLVTRNTAEEKILQIGRKKMVLDQLIIENMATKEENVPYQEILSFGAAALFEDDGGKEFNYDENSVDKLIESSYADIADDEAENNGEGDKPKDSFGFAKVWAGDSMADALEEDTKEVTDDLWQKILAQRAAEAKAEAEKKLAEFSKGRRRNNLNYSEANNGRAEGEDGRRNRANIDAANRANGDKSDTEDFAGSGISSSDSSDAEVGSMDDFDVGDHDKKSTTNGRDLEISGLDGVRHLLNTTAGTSGGTPKHLPSAPKMAYGKCRICGRTHLSGQCQIRFINVEICILCKKSHFSGGRQCPAFQDVKELRRILEDLKQSAEPSEQVDAAKQYVIGTIGSIHRSAREKRNREFQQSNPKAMNIPTESSNDALIIHH